MKAQKIFLYFLLLYAIVVLFVRCMALAGFQTGRTAGKGQWQRTVSADYFNAIAYLFPHEDGPGIELDEAGKMIVIEGDLKYGVGRRVDVGLRVNSAFLWGFNGKVQVVGNQRSDFAVAVGLEGGRLAEDFYFQIPISYSYHFSKSSVVYISPKYITHYVRDKVFAEKYDFLTYTGGNLGFFIGVGKKSQLGFDYGYFWMRGGRIGKRLGTERQVMHSFGLGVRF